MTMMQVVAAGIAAFVGIVGAAFAYTFLLGWLVMLCWNYLAPIFSVPLLGWWQACVLMFMCSILFKSTASFKKSE